MKRTRDKSRVSSVATTTTFGNVRTGYTQSSHGSCLVIDNNWMTDEVTPKYHKMSGQGLIFNKPMEKLVDNRNLLAVEIRKSKGDNFWGTSHGWHPMYLEFNPATDETVSDEVRRLEALAITEAYADVGSSDIELLVELAELRETISFLMSPLAAMKRNTLRLTAYLRKQRRLEANFQKRLARWLALPPRVQAKRPKPVLPVIPKFTWGKWEVTDVSSAWLAYRYAIMPLIYTFQDVEALIKKRAEGPAVRATARAKQKSTISLYRESVPVRYYANNGDTIEHHVRVGTADIVTRAGVLYEVEWSLMSQLGLRLHRVPAALYETIPLSFVTDWFHNGATVYDALTAEFRAQKILGAWVKSSVAYDLQGQFIMAPGSPDSRTSGTHQTFEGFGTWHRRKPVTLADVRFMFRTELNTKRVADGLALIHVLLATALKKK